MERKWTCCLSFRQKLQVNHSLRLATVEIKLFRQTLRLAKAKIKLFSHTLRLDISLGIFQDLSLLLNALEELHCHFALYFSSNIYMMPVYRSYLIVVIKITYIARFPFSVSLFPMFPLHPTKLPLFTFALVLHINIYSIFGYILIFKTTIIRLLWRYLL